MRRHYSSAVRHPLLNPRRKNANRLETPMLKPRKSVQTKWGLCPQTPGIYRFRAEIFCSILTGRLAPPRPSQPPSRRSGRIPALPYPPLGSTIHIGRTLSTLTSAVSANNHAGQFRQHSSRQLKTRLLNICNHVGVGFCFDSDVQVLELWIPVPGSVFEFG